VFLNPSFYLSLLIDLSCEVEKRFAMEREQINASFFAKMFKDWIGSVSESY